MGRPYQQELNAIQETYLGAGKADVDRLKSFFERNISVPLVIIGSGGSYAGAAAAALCYQSIGGFAKAITPFELQDEGIALKCSKVLLITAGGNNNDIISAYEYIRLLEPCDMFTICMSENSKIIQRSVYYHDHNYLELRIAFGKDGFLAVNSTIALFGILEKVYMQLHGMDEKQICIKRTECFENTMRDFADCETLIVLYGGWGKPAALDMESKCVEAGLMNIQCANYRNFAHGRHHWIARNGGNTGVIVLGTEDNQKLIKKTVEYLPEQIPKKIFISENKGMTAALELLIHVFDMVGEIGKWRGLDPGRPAVPEFGRKLYGIKYNLLTHDVWLKKVRKDIYSECLYRLLGKVERKDAESRTYQKMLKQYLEELCGKKYRLLILDYDDTLKQKGKHGIDAELLNELKKLLDNGIYIGIATGRDFSLREKIKNFFSREEQKKIYIGYYNASVILPLSEEPSQESTVQGAIRNFDSIICNYPIISNKLLKGPYQYSVIEYRSEKRDFYYRYIMEVIERERILGLKVLKSGHSIDIMEERTSKNDLVAKMEREFSGASLRIGDSGEWMGNDYELLSVGNSLSVERQNVLGMCGWNIAPLGMKKTMATLWYLKCLEIHEGYFLIDRSKIEKRK